MVLRRTPGGARAHTASAVGHEWTCRPAQRPTHISPETFMTWDTPTATDFRFGFEITMYIAAR